MLLKQRPPVTVIIVCAFELIGILLLPSAFFKETTRAIGLWYQIYIVATGLVSALAIRYLWRMKKVGLYIYFAMSAAHNIRARGELACVRSDNPAHRRGFASAACEEDGIGDTAVRRLTFMGSKLKLVCQKNGTVKAF